MVQQEPAGNVSSTAKRVADLLELLAARPRGYGVTELARALGTYRAPLYKITLALEHAQLVKRTADGRFVLGVATLRLAQAYSSLYPAQVQETLSQVANETLLTASLISVEEDVFTAVLSEVPATSGEHVYTPPGFRYSVGPLAMRIAYESIKAPSDQDDEDVRLARSLGYAVGKGEVLENRYSIATVVPGSAASAEGATLILVLVGLSAFEPEQMVEPLKRTAQLVGFLLNR